MILRHVEAGAGPSVALLHGLFGAGGNFSAVQRRLAERFRVIALDLRNHGASPHGADVSYAAMAGDVLDTLGALGALPVALVGHSMGGKVAMQAALARPETVRRLLVADIAPVRYPPHFRALAAAMQAIELRPGLTRRDADQALAGVTDTPSLRAFLLQNLSFDAAPAWRIGLDEIAAGLPGIEGWDAPPGAAYSGPTLVLAGERSDYIKPEHRAVFRALFPLARFVTLRNAGHWMHADQPEAFTEIVGGFAAG